MAKRGKIAFGAGGNFFRISKPGYDVDVASKENLIIDESVFYPQIFTSGIVSNPNLNADNYVTVNFPDQGFSPAIYAYVVTDDGIISVPCRVTYRPSNHVGGAVKNVQMSYTSNSNSMTVFFEAAGGGSIVSSVYYAVLRKPRN